MAGSLLVPKPVDCPSGLEQPTLNISPRRFALLPAILGRGQSKGREGLAEQSGEIGPLAIGAIPRDEYVRRSRLKQILAGANNQRCVCSSPRSPTHIGAEHNGSGWIIQALEQDWLEIPVLGELESLRGERRMRGVDRVLTYVVGRPGPESTRTLDGSDETATRRSPRSGSCSTAQLRT